MLSGSSPEVVTPYSHISKVLQSILDISDKLHLLRKKSLAMNRHLCSTCWRSNICLHTASQAIGIAQSHTLHPAHVSLAVTWVIEDQSGSIRCTNLTIHNHIFYGDTANSVLVVSCCSVMVCCVRE